MQDHEFDGIVRRRIAAIQHMRLALDALARVKVSEVLDEAERGNFSRLYIELARILSEMRSKKAGAGLSAQD